MTHSPEDRKEEKAKEGSEEPQTGNSAGAQNERNGTQNIEKVPGENQGRGARNVEMDSKSEMTHSPEDRKEEKAKEGSEEPQTRNSVGAQNERNETQNAEKVPEENQEGGAQTIEMDPESEMAPSEKFWKDCEKVENEIGSPLETPASPKNRKKDHARRDRRLATQKRLAEEAKKRRNAKHAEKGERNEEPGGERILRNRGWKTRRDQS
jgi:hypothetical protein